MDGFYVEWEVKTDLADEDNVAAVPPGREVTTAC